MNGKRAAAGLCALIIAGSPAIAQDLKHKLVGRTWTVVSAGDVEPSAAKPAYLNFTPSGQLTGSGGCNRINGRYSVSGSGSSLKIERLATTRMLCAPAVMTAERALISALNSSSAARAKNGGLILTRGGSTLVVLE